MVIVIAIVAAGFVLPAAYLHLCLFLAKDSQGDKDNSPVAF